MKVKWKEKKLKQKQNENKTKNQWKAVVRSKGQKVGQIPCKERTMKYRNSGKTGEKCVCVWLRAVQLEQFLFNYWLFTLFCLLFIVVILFYFNISFLFVVLLSFHSHIAHVSLLFHRLTSLLLLPSFGLSFCR